jgi:hypothetical protein
MGHNLRLVPSGAQALGELGELLSSDLRDVAAGETRSQPLGLTKGPFELVAVGRLAQPVEVELVGGRDRVCPIGDDPESVEIAGDQQRRVFKRQRVTLELIDSLIQASSAALVLLAEASAFPNVRPAFTAGRLGGAALKAIPLAFGVCVGRLRLVQQLAKIVEVGLRSGTLFQLSRLPFRDELLRCHDVAQMPQIHMESRFRMLASTLKQKLKMPRNPSLRQSGRTISESDR